MKMLLSVFCAASLLLRAAMGNAAPAFGQQEDVSFADAGMLIVETEGVRRATLVLPLHDLLEHKSIPSSNGDMTIILSPHERIAFKSGKLTDYFCIEEFGRQCRANVDGAQMTQSFGGELKTSDGTQPLTYSTKIYGLKEGARQLSPEAIRSIDDVAVMLSYKGDSFVISKGH